MGYSPEDLPIVGLTASVMRHDFCDLGMTGWLTKPVKINDLRNTIDQSVTKSRKALASQNV
jgi:CheY-like chemotaxis protein